jgi:hypothetical protein
MAIDRSCGGQGQPATDALLVTPNDSSDLPFITRAVYIGGAGNLAVVMHSGLVAVFVSLPAGSLIPVRVVKVFATGTTATNLLAMD